MCGECNGFDLCSCVHIHVNANQLKFSEEKQRKRALFLSSVRTHVPTLSREITITNFQYDQTPEKRMIKPSLLETRREYGKWRDILKRKRTHERSCSLKRTIRYNCRTLHTQCVSSLIYEKFHRSFSFKLFAYNMHSGQWQVVGKMKRPSILPNCMRLYSTHLSICRCHYYGNNKNQQRSIDEHIWSMFRLYPYAGKEDFL